MKSLAGWIVSAAMCVGFAGLASAESSGSVTLRLSTGGAAATSGAPFSSGVPFPRGAVSTVDHLRVETTSGTEVPANYWKLVSWPDGSVKVALISFTPSPAGDTYANTVVQYGPAVTHVASGPVQVTQDGSSLTVTTDVLKLQFSKTRFSILEQAWTDVNDNGTFDTNEKWLTSAADLEVLDRKTQKIFRSSLWTSADGYTPTLVESGPRKATILLEGRLKGEGGAQTADGDATLLQAKVWLTVFAGSTQIRVQTTLVDTKSRPTETFSDRILKISSIALNLPLTLTDPSYAAGGESGTVYQGTVGGGAHLLQDATATFSSQFSYVFNYSGVGSGAKAPGWMDVSDSGRGVTMALRHFWQSYPHKLAMQGDGAMRVEFLPADSPNYLWTVYPGVGKTYEAFLDFHAGGYGTSVRRRAEIALAYPLLIADTTWYAQTQVFGPISPKSDRSGDWELRVENQYNCTVLRQGCSIYPLPYGQRNFGDFQQGFATSSSGVFSPIYGDGHYEDAHGMLLQFARTGERKWFDAATPYARHHYDFDVMHTENPPRYPGYPAGMIHWHGTNEHEGVNIEMGHVVPGGLDDYFYLTGDPRALDVLREQGNWMEYWARKGMGRIAPEKDTDKVGLEEYERVGAWTLYTLMKSFETTNDPKYFEAASILAKNTVDWWKMPQDHIVFSAGQQMDLTRPAKDQALYYYRTDWTQGTGYPLPTLRVANCPQTSAPISNYAYQSHAPIAWMSALLQTAIIRYYMELERQGGSFDKSVSYRGTTKQIAVDTATIREMLIQMMKTVVEHNYLGLSTDASINYPSKYPWLKDYNYKYFIYSVCPGRDVHSTDGGLYIQWPLLFISSFKKDQVSSMWQSQWDGLSKKFQNIAMMQFDKFVVRKPNPLTGYNGVPDLWNEAYAVNYMEKLGLLGGSPNPDPDPTPDPVNYQVSINDGNPFLLSPSVTLSITAPPTAAEINLSAAGYGQGAWQAVDQAHGMELPPGAGTKTLYAQFRTSSGTLLASVRRSVVLLQPGQPLTATLLLNDASDTSLKSNLPATNFGADPKLTIGKDASGEARGLLKFTLPQPPAGLQMTVKGARLQLYVSGITPNASQAINVFEAAGDWQESQATWASQPAKSSTAAGPNVTFTGPGDVNTWKELTLDAPRIQGWFQDSTKALRGLVIDGDGVPAPSSIETVSSEGFMPTEDRRPVLALQLELAVNDSTPPVISGVEAAGINPTSATVQWATNEAADSKAEYGPTTAYGSTTPVQTELITTHTALLTGLTMATAYHVRVTSKDAAGNSATSADLTFTTTSALLGDVNRDGLITAADVTAMIGQLLGLSPATPDTADLNADGKVTLGDLQALVNRL